VNNDLLLELQDWNKDQEKIFHDPVRQAQPSWEWYDRHRA